MLKIIRSGGQTGADIAGVRAAKKSGKLEYCGLMPKGFKTLDGPKPEYATEYNMKEHSSPSYPPRTFENVRDSDATMRFAVNMESAGEKCTLKAIVQYHKPHFDVHITNTSSFSLPPANHPKTAAQWLRDRGVICLNIAGNSEKTAPGIESFVERYALAMFEEYFKIEAEYERTAGKNHDAV